MIKIIYIALIMSISMLSVAGGNPEHVVFPKAYKSNFTQYGTVNRANGKQIAHLYANKVAIDSASKNELANGSVIIMEIYKAKLVYGAPVKGDDGIFIKDKFAAVAVMEKKSNWDDSFDTNNRSGDWGFALYNTDGSTKDNKLDCASCHNPLSDKNYLFSQKILFESTN